MITAEHGPLISRPVQWVVVFDPTRKNTWTNRLTPGNYKHVRAYGYVPFLHVWLFVDANFAGLELIVAADGVPANQMIAAWIGGCDLVLMPRRPHDNRSGWLAMSGWCVPVITRLLGLGCVALTPDALFARCLQHGGQLYARQRPSGPDTAAATGDAAGGAGTGRAAVTDPVRPGAGVHAAHG